MRESPRFRRIIWIILDGVGLGSLPDAENYGDAGADTLGNLARSLGGLRLPHLERLGLGKVHAVAGLSPNLPAAGAYGRLREASPGKDSTTGHWELTGVILERPFPTYPKGFPPDLVREFERRIGRKVLGNKPASGTEIIQELGEEHLRTGRPILYTSADSVFQLAAHKEVIPLQELYAICGIARELLAGEHNVCRVIARPFIGSPGKFKRVNEERRDFSLLPPRETVLDCVLRSRKLVLGAGKVADLFGGRGFSSCPHTANNSEALHELIRMIGEDSEGVIMVNLVDFDMVYGHRNDCEGFANALAEFDAFLPEVERALHSDDVCFITSDHGCDPTYPGTDHTREYGLFLAFGPQIKGDTDIGVRQSFADCGKTVSELLGLNCRLDGFSFAELIT